MERRFGRRDVSNARKADEKRAQCGRSTRRDATGVNAHNVPTRFIDSHRQVDT